MKDRPITLDIYHKEPLPEDVRLLAPDMIPKVERIASFRSDDQMVRIGSLPLIASRLPRLQTCHWEYYNGNKLLNSIRVRRDRYGTRQMTEFIHVLVADH
jgi:hypothetical protein